MSCRSLDFLFLLVFAVTLRVAGAVPHSPAVSSPDSRFVVGDLLVRDDFGDGLDRWQWELDKGGSVITRDGSLEIDVPGGCTVWLKSPLSGPVLISYEATVIGAGGPNDRVSDLNCFWMAQDARSPGNIFGTVRNGKFADYDQLQCYYVGHGGNSNTTTRFRRYIGEKGNRPIRPEDDLAAKEFLLRPNATQTIQLVAAGPVIEYFCDGRRFFSYEDPQPYTSGWFALRTITSHFKVKNFRVHRLLPTAEAPALEVKAQRTADAKTPPNIIFILADDLGYGDLGCYGQTRIKTPHLDQLATQGIRFTQFYAGAPVCAPSRNVLMTGQHTGHATVRGNAKVDLRADEITIADVLKRAGYATGLVGKWGLGKEGSPGSPRRKGFDYFYGYVDQSMAHNYYPTFLVRNEEHVPLRNVVPNAGPYGQGVATVKLDYSADLMADEAVKFVRDHRRGPFFLYFATTLPHANDEAKPDGMEVPDYGPYAHENWATPLKGYAAMVTRLDAQIGRLMAELKMLGLEDNTLVIFTSDNGPHNEGGNDPGFFKSSGPLRGIKRDLYEGGIREPLIVRWPSHTRAGVTSDHVGYFGDFMATFAELAGAKPPARIDSTSFLPVITGNTSTQKEHEYLYWEFYEGASAQAVRMGRWKAVRSPMETGKMEVYDLDTDLGEQHDIANQHPEIIARAAEAMKNAHVPSPLWKVGGAAQSVSTGGK